MDAKCVEAKTDVIKSKHVERKSDDVTKVHNPNGDPVALPSPPMDGKKPIPPGDLEVEKFLVTTDTGGGD